MKSAYLAGFLGLDFIRHRVMVFLLLAFPALIMTMAVLGSPEATVPLVLDGEAVTPPPDPEAIQVLSFAMTAAVLVTSLTGFFTGYQLRSITPRLQVMGYRTGQVFLGHAVVILVVNAFAVAFVGTLALVWIDPVAPGGHYLALLLGSVTFSLIGVLLARLADSRALGLNLLLALAVLDTAFLENPVLSRRFTEGWLDVMPAHRPVQLLYRAGFTGEDLWGWDTVAPVLYSAALLLLLLLTGRFRK